MASILERLELLEATMRLVLKQIEALQNPSPPSPTGDIGDSRRHRRGDKRSDMDPERLAKRREQDRKYQREKRKLSLAAANPVTDVAANVAVMSPSATLPATLASPPSHTLPPHQDPLLFEELTSEEARKKEVESARARGTRMVAGAQLSDPARLMARQLGADEWQIERWWAEFVDYWCAVPGRHGLKIDWAATWRNRVRKLLQDREDSDGKSALAAGRRFFDNPAEFYRRFAFQTGADCVDYVPEPAPLRVVSKR
jgi:hypothetical protein